MDLADVSITLHSSMESNQEENYDEYNPYSDENYSPINDSDPNLWGQDDKTLDRERDWHSKNAPELIEPRDSRWIKE